MSYIQMYIQANILHMHRFIQRKERFVTVNYAQKIFKKMPIKRRFTKTESIMAIIIAALVILLCISSIMRTNMQNKYSSARHSMQEQLYVHLQDMTELFSRIDDPDIDVQYKLIPYLRASYTAVVSLNTALSDGFGASSALLSDEQIAAFDNAFNEYAAAYRGGGPTGLAEADMRECMESIQPIVDERFAEPTVDPNLLVVPNTPKP